MDILLDTHLILYRMYEAHRLSEQARIAMSSPENRLFFSAVNL